MTISNGTNRYWWLLLFCSCSGRTVDLDTPTDPGPAESDPNVVITDTQISEIWAEGSRLYWVAVPAKWDGHSFDSNHPEPIFFRGCDVNACAQTTTTYDQANTAAGGFSSPAIVPGRVSWMNRSAIRTCPSTGCDGAPGAILLGADPYSRFAGDGAHVCWAEAQAAYCCPTSGCGELPNPFPEARPPLSQLAAGGGYLYWSAFNQIDAQYEIRRGPITGSSTSSLLAKTADSGQIVLGPTEGYLAQHLDGGGMSVCNLAQCVEFTLLRRARTAPDASVYGLRVDDTDFYWLELGPNEGESVLKRCAVTGCAEPESLLAGVTNIGAFALSADTIYWTKSLSPSVGFPFGRAIHRAPK